MSLKPNKKYELKTKDAVSNVVMNKLAEGVDDLRDRAIILFLMDTGARVSELVSQDRDMIKVGTEVLLGEFKFAATSTLPIAKSKGRRDLYISARALEALNLYLECREDANPALFATRSGERMRTEQVRKLLYVWCDQLGIERFPAHDFRRSLAESLLGARSPYIIVLVLGYSLSKYPIRLILPISPRYEENSEQRGQ